MKQAYYSAAIESFLSTHPNEILGALVAAHGHELEHRQKNAWLDQVAILHRELKTSPHGWIAFEFVIPRMGKRVDAIIIRKNVVFVIEFKVGTESYDGAAVDQVNDYALDLKNFHLGSHNHPLVPILIATDAPPRPMKPTWYEDGIAFTAYCNGSGLDSIFFAYESSAPGKELINGPDWARSGYKPTPTIIEAAQALYAGHKVEDITRTDASAKNLSATAAELSRVIERSKKNGEKSICFVTGVPGAGKTLAGLNLVTKRTDKEEHAVFLSGNGPLVKVLREALALDECARAEEAGQRLTQKEAQRRVAPFIQNIHHFRDDNLKDQAAPLERVTVFDEAQRAWNAKKLAAFMSERGVRDFEKSEPEFLIEVMNRHRKWCTIVCLVGGGQEINAGEAGLLEWFHALKEKFPGWKVYTSPILENPDYHWGQNLSDYLKDLDHEVLPDLHLSVSVRSFRAEKLSAFVGSLISGKSEDALRNYEAIKTNYPIAITRDLSTARSWLRRKARGSERFGLVASSKAVRLKAHGLNVKVDIVPEDWFLKPKTDVRSSYFMEDLATEFQVQGLELDWVGVCWEGNYRREANAWEHYEFKGTSWNRLRDSFKQVYLANAYRVLLTRARQGMIIFVPKGSEIDDTRKAEYYDETWAYLKQCGLQEA